MPDVILLNIILAMDQDEDSRVYESTSKSRERAAKGKVDEESSKKGSVLAYSILSKEDSEEILGLNVVEMERKLQETFQLSPTTDLKDAAILDYYVGATYWGKEQGFTSQQISGFFSVIHTLMHKLKDQTLSLVELINDFRKMLVGVGADVGSDNESGGIEFFTIEQAKAITDYLHSSLFQHHKLYEYMFTNSQYEEIIGSDLSVEVPLPADTPFPPPLDEGISESTFKEFLSIPTPSISETQDDVKQQEEELKAASPIQVELPPEVEDIFNKLTIEDVRMVIMDTTSEVLHNLQTGVENKIKTQENNMLTKINKIHNIIPEPIETEEVSK